MKSKDIIRQLQAVLPKVTDLFSETLSITTLTRSGTTVKATTSGDHSLTTGAGLTITGAQSPITISSLTFLNGVATAITAANHDLTEEFQNGIGTDTPLVTVSGATESEYNGANPLLTVPNRTKFTYTVTGTPTTPATGTPTLLEQFNTGYNGRHVVTVTGATTFTYEITQTPDSPAQGTIEAHTLIRVTGAVTVEAAQAAYTAKNDNKLWGFVVLGDVVTSKDRHTLSDATGLSANGTEYRQRLLMPFSVFVIVPTVNEIAGSTARDQMEDVRTYLYKSLLRVEFETELQSITRYGVIPERDFFFTYDSATYIHGFDFSTQTDVVYGDTVDPGNSVAFRDIELQYLDDLDTVELTANVNLDEEP